METEGELIIYSTLLQIRSISDTDKQLELFDSILENLRGYQPNALSKIEADDIDKSLDLVTSLSKSHSTELVIRTIHFAEQISALRTTYLFKMVPFLYNLSNCDDPRCCSAVYSAFANIYVLVLLAAERCISVVKPDVQDMWSHAELLRRKLLSYYSSGNDLSLICLRFISLCCHYFTYRDDILLYSGKTGIGDMSIQFTIDSIPISNRLLNQANLINDGYDYVDKLVQAFTTKASVFTFKHKIIAINGLFSLITHRKNFIPLILPVLLKNTPTNETAFQVMVSNYLRLLKLPTFGEVEEQIEMFLETNGLRGDMIKRAKEQQQRMSEYLDKKSIILSPIPLSPPFPHDYTLSVDSLYNQELRLALKQLNSSALEPLPIPSIPLHSIPLAKLKQLPISLLATLVLTNLSNTPRSLVVQETEEFYSQKREHSDNDSKKRPRNEGVLCECEELNEPRRSSLQDLLLRISYQCALSPLMSDAPMILCDCAISLISICGSDQFITILRTVFIPDTLNRSTHILVSFFQKLIDEISLLHLFLRRLFIRHTLIQKKSGYSTNTSDSYLNIYTSVLVFLLQHELFLIDENENQSAEEGSKLITDILVSLPLIPQEVYALLLCVHSRGDRQLVLTDCVVYCMCSLAVSRPSSVYDCLSILIGLASCYEAQSNLSVYMTQFKQLLSDTNYAEILETYLMTPEESPISQSLQSLASFAHGTLILREDEAIPQARIQESGRFRMVHEETIQSQTERNYQQNILSKLHSPALWLVYACMTVSSSQMLDGLLEYQHTHDNDTQNDSKDWHCRMIHEYVVDSLPLLADTLISLNDDEIEGQNGFAMQYDETSQQYQDYLGMLQILLKYVNLERESVLVILKERWEISGIPKNEEFMSIVDQMFEESGDIRFKFLLYHWLSEEDAQQLIKQIPEQPLEQAKETLNGIAKQPSPLTLELVLLELCSLVANRDVLMCLQICAENPYFSELVFQNVIVQLTLETPPSRILMYVVIIAIKAKPGMSKMICDSLLNFTKQKRWEECDQQMWNSFIQFVKKCGEITSELLYFMTPSRLGDVFQKIPESKAWYLEYIEDHQLSIPDEVVPVLQA